MLMKKSLFDFGYFRYTLRRMLPYSLVMLLILILSSFLVFGITDEVSSLAIGKIRYIGVELLGCTSTAFMYIIPIALCIGMFGFIHKKNYADFILSSPVKRSSVFFTNIISALIMISVMLVVNLLFIALVISAGENYQAYVSAGDYFLSFFYNLAGYMLVFAASSFAAVITGTAITQAYMTFIILFLPTFITAYIQFPFLIQSYTSFMTSQYTIPLNQILLIPNIPAMPITQIMLTASGYQYAEFYGIHYFFEAKSICYTLLVAVLYVIAGMLLFRKYKAENAGKSFVNKGVGIFAYAGSFGPVMALIFLIFAHADYTDMFDSPLFYLFIIVSFISFIIATLIFNKGFTEFGKHLVIYLVLIISTSVISGIINVTAERSLKTIDFRTDEIKSVSVYMKPVNAQPITDTYVSKNYIKVKIDDEDMLDLLSGGNDTGTDYYCEITLSNGKQATVVSRLTEEFINALYNYIDENVEIKKTLLFLPGADHVVCTSLNIETSHGYSTYSSSFEKKNEIQKKITEREKEYLDIPISKLYQNRNSVTRFGYVSNYEEDMLNYGFINSDSVNFSLAALRNYNGQYYASNYFIDNSSQFFNGFAKESHERAERILKKIDSSTTVSIAGAFDLGEEQYILLDEIIPSLPAVMPGDFSNAVKNALNEPIGTENIVAVAISSEKETALVFMDVERDIKPLIDIYLERVTEMLDKRADESGKADSAEISQSYYMDGMYTKGMEAYLAVNAMFGGELSESGAYFDLKAFGINCKDLSELIKSEKDYINSIVTRKYTKDTLSDEYYFISVITDFNDMSGRLKPAVIPISKEMLLTISDEFEYLDSKAELFDSNKVQKAICDPEYYTDITGRKDIEYLMLLLKDSYFRNTTAGMFDNYSGYYVYSGEPDFAFYHYGSVNIDYIYNDGTVESAEILDTDHVQEVLIRKAGEE